MGVLGLSNRLKGPIKPPSLVGAAVMADANLNDLLESLQKQVEEAYQRGITVGRGLEREALMAYLNGTASRPLLAVALPPIEDGEAKRKAPRGLIASILKELLTEAPGTTLPELEIWAVAKDPRIARKTVYNHLNANRDTLYRYSNGKWYLRDTPSAPTVPGAELAALAGSDVPPPTWPPGTSKDAPAAAPVPSWGAVTQKPGWSQ